MTRKNQDTRSGTGGRPERGNKTHSRRSRRRPMVDNLKTESGVVVNTLQGDINVNQPAHVSPATAERSKRPGPASRKRTQATRPKKGQKKAASSGKSSRSRSGSAKGRGKPASTKRGPSSRRQRPPRKTRPHPLPSLGVPEKDELVFANRVRESRELRQDNKYDFYMVYAPAGYGKSRLLKQLLVDFYEDGWLSFYLCFKANTSAQASTFAVLIGLLDSLQEKTGDIATESDAMERLAGILADEGGRALFVFDSVECATDDVFSWIGDTLLADLKNRSRNHRVRAFFGCRYSRRLPGGGASTTAGVHLQPYSLSRFHEDDLALALRTWAPQLKNDEAESSRVARDVLELTRGHPGCIARVFRVLTKNKFNYHRTNGRFREDRRRELFDSCVAPVVRDEILAGVAKDSLPILRLAFTFRNVSPTFIELLRDEPELAGCDFTDPFAGQSIMGRHLWPTHLLAPPTSHEAEWQIADPAVRHFFAEENLIHDRDRARTLHGTIKNCFMAWFEGDGAGLPHLAVGPEQNRCFVEGLYHLCRELEASEASLEDRRSQIVQLPHVWAAHSRPQYQDHVLHADNLVGMLDDPDEVDIPALVDALAGEGAFRSLTQALRNAASDLWAREARK